MLVKDLMTRNVSSCRPENNLMAQEESRASLRIEISVLPLGRGTSGLRTCLHEMFHLGAI